MLRFSAFLYEIIPKNVSNKSENCSDIGYFEIPLEKYSKPLVAGLKRVLIKYIDQMNPSVPILTTAKALDNIWMASYYVSDPSKCPSWSGFNQTVISQEQ